MFIKFSIAVIFILDCPLVQWEQTSVFLTLTNINIAISTAPCIRRYRGLVQFLFFSRPVTNILGPKVNSRTNKNIRTGITPVTAMTAPSLAVRRMLCKTTKRNS